MHVHADLHPYRGMDLETERHPFELINPYQDAIFQHLDAVICTHVIPRHG